MSAMTNERSTRSPAPTAGIPMFVNNIGDAAKHVSLLIDRLRTVVDRLAGNNDSPVGRASDGPPSIGSLGALNDRCAALNESLRLLDAQIVRLEEALPE